MLVKLISTQRQDIFPKDRAAKIAVVVSFSLCLNLLLFSPLLRFREIEYLHNYKKDMSLCCFSDSTSKIGNMPAFLAASRPGVVLGGEGEFPLENIHDNNMLQVQWFNDSSI